MRMTVLVIPYIQKHKLYVRKSKDDTIFESSVSSLILYPLVHRALYVLVLITPSAATANSTNSKFCSIDEKGISSQRKALSGNRPAVQEVHEA